MVEGEFCFNEGEMSIQTVERQLSDETWSARVSLFFIFFLLTRSTLTTCNKIMLPFTVGYFTGFCVFFKPHSKRLKGGEIPYCKHIVRFGQKLSEICPQSMSPLLSFIPENLVQSPLLVHTPSCAV